MLCGTNADPTVEHIIPQTLWKRFGIDPDMDHLAQYRTDLCEKHNAATSSLHRRAEMMELIETGEPVTRKTLTHLADWAIWVTLLLGLARGSGVLDPSWTRDLLLRRFDSTSGGTPRGMRVYAARVSAYVSEASPPATRYCVALTGDPSVLLDADGRPRGFSVGIGPIEAGEAIGLGKIALLVVGRTFSSGDGHSERLDDAATTVGLQRIWPLPNPLPNLPHGEVSITDVSRLFTVLPFGSDLSLMPEALQGWDR